MSTCSAGLNLQPANKAQVLNLFFQREEERGSHSQSCAASPLLDAAAALSLSLSILLVLRTMSTILNA